MKTTIEQLIAKDGKLLGGEPSLLFAVNINGQWYGWYSKEGPPKKIKPPEWDRK